MVLAPHSLQLMKHIGFKGGSPRASTCAEPMESITGLDSPRQEVIQNPRHHLPDYFSQANSTEVYVPLQDQDNGLSGTLFCKVTLKEGVWNQTDKLFPVGGVE